MGHFVVSISTRSKTARGQSPVFRVQSYVLADHQVSSGLTDLAYFTRVCCANRMQ